MRSIRVAILAVMLVPLRLAAQQKVDSILITLPAGKAAAMEQVLAGFMLAGLDVTDNSGNLVTADLGEKNSGWVNVDFHRSVRALLVPADSTSTRVLITGIETRGQNGRITKRLRIDNRAGGNGEKVWCQMVMVSMSLDSTQVDPAIRKTEKCAERLSK